MDNYKGNICVDFDGTLAKYTTWLGPDVLGEPIPEMVARVRRALEMGYEVRIFTARAAHEEDAKLAIPAIEAWCLAQFGQVLVVTCSKDMHTVEIWDDRAVAVEHNSGEFVGLESRIFAD